MHANPLAPQAFDPVLAVGSGVDVSGWFRQLADQSPEGASSPHLAVPGLTLRAVREALDRLSEGAQATTG